MSMPFSPCPTDGSACNDASVEVLRQVFGPVIDKLVKGQSTDGVEAVTNTLGSMMGVFNSGILVVVGLLMTGIIMMSVMNTANDGEVMGKNWSAPYTVLRMVAGGAALLPTSAGYSFIQIIVLTISLWAVGLANVIYKQGVEVGILRGDLGAISAKQGITNNKINETYALADIRTFAEGLTRSFYCAHVSNNNFKTASGERVAVGTSQKPESVIEETSRTASNYWFSDRNIKTNLAGGDPVCGIVTVYGYKSQINPSDLTNAPGTTELQALRFALYQAKSDAMTGMFASVKAWVNSWPTSINQDGSEKIQSNRLNEIVQDAENKFLADFSNKVHTDETLNKILKSYVDSSTESGWLYAGGFYQKQGEARGIINDLMAEPVAIISGPNVGGFPNSEQSRVVKLSVATIPNIVLSKALEKRTTVSPADISSVIGNELTASVGVASADAISAKTESVFTSWIDSGMKTVVSTLLGTSGNVDAIGRIKATGDIFKVMTTSSIITDKVAHRAISSARAIAATAGSVRVMGNSIDLEPLFSAILDMVDHIFLKPLAEISSWLGILAFYFGVFLPSLPYSIFFIAGVGFFLQVLQTLVAAPLWAMMHMLPERSFVGSQTQGYLLLLSLLVRPALLVVGLFAAFSLANPILNVVTEAFFAVKGSVGSNTHWIINFLQWKNWLIVYGLLLLPIMLMIFGLPQTLPDAVLQWIGVNIQSLGETQATNEMRSNTEKYGPSPSSVGGPPRPPALGGGGSSRQPSIQPGGGGGGGRGSIGRSEPISLNPQGITPSNQL